MKFLDLILNREPVTSPLLLKIISEQGFKSKYLKNIIEESKQEDKAILFVFAMLKHENINQIDSQCIKFLNLVAPVFFKNLKNVKIINDFYITTYKNYFNFLYNNPLLFDSNISEIKDTLLNIQKINTDVNFMTDSVFTLPLWRKTISHTSFNDIDKFLNLNFSNKLQLNQIKDLVKSVINCDNQNLKKDFYPYLLSHEFHMYFDVILNETPEIVFDNIFLEKFIKSEKTRSYDICQFLTSNDSTHSRITKNNQQPDFIKDNRENIIESFKYIFNQHNLINKQGDASTSVQERVFIDEHIRDISNFINNNPQHALSCYIIEAATLSKPDFPKKLTLTAPLFKAVNPHSYSYEAKKEEAILYKAINTIDPFLLNYLVKFYDKHIDISTQHNIAENFLRYRFKDTPFPVYKDVHDDLITTYQIFKNDNFNLNVYILDDIEETINKYNSGATQRHTTGKHEEINLNYDHIKERFMFLGNNPVNLIDAANMYGLKYDTYLSTISETETGAYENYKEGLNWTVGKIAQSDLANIDISALTYFFQVNFFNFSEDNIPELAKIFSSIKNENFLEEDGIKDKINSNQGNLTKESIELLRSLIQKNILSESINIIPSTIPELKSKRKRL